MGTENVDFILAARNLTGGAFGQVRSSLNGLGQQVISVRGIIGTLTAAFGVGAFAAGIRSASEAADAAAKMGDRFGIATGKLIGMQHAGDLAGVSQNGLSTALRSQAKFAADAARGAEEQTKAMRQLGIDAAEFIRLPMDQQMKVMIDRLGQVENVTLRNALAQEAWGRGAGEMMGLVAEGSEALTKATEDALAWGVALNRVDAAKLEIANDAITRAQTATKGLFTTIAVNVSPAIAALANGFADSAAEANGYRDQVGRAVEMTVTGVAYAANVVQGLRFAYAAARLAVAEFADLSVRAWITVIDTARNSGLLRFLELMPGPIGVAAGAMINFGERASKALHDVRISTRNTAAEIKLELDSIAEQGLPADKIIAKFREIRERLAVEAAEIARRRQEMMGGAGEEIEQDKAAGGKAPKDTWRDQLASKVERIREENMTELQLLDEKLREKNLILQAWVEADASNEEQGMQLSFDLQKKYNDAKWALSIQEQQREAQKHSHLRNMQLGTFQYASGLLQALAGNSKLAAIAVIAINKGLAIAQTIQATSVAVMRAFADLGPIAGAPVAASMKTLGAIQIGLIAATGLVEAANVGSGGASAGTPANPISVVPSVPAPTGAGGGDIRSLAPTSAAAVDREFNVTIVGRSSDRVTYGEVVDDIMPLFEQAVKSGASRMKIEFVS